MVRNYKPVDVRAIHWAKLFKAIQASGQAGVAVYDLEDEFGVPRHDASMAKGLEQLEQQGRIRRSVGRSRAGLCCHVVQAVVPVVRKRDRVVQDPPEQNLEEI